MLTFEMALYITNKDSKDTLWIYSGILWNFCYNDYQDEYILRLL